jgi:hypothetical protein
MWNPERIGNSNPRVPGTRVRNAPYSPSLLTYSLFTVMRALAGNPAQALLV